MFTVGILQCGHAPEALVAAHGDYDTMFERLLGNDDFSYRTYAVVDGTLPESVRAADGWLVTGSRFGVYEDHPWIARLEAFLRAAYAAAVPIVGICFGHQVLAQALGGKVEKFAGGWSLGAVDYTVTGEVGAGEGRTRLLAFHQDQVVEPPPGATVTGSTPFCRYAFLAYGERAISMQPHPEFTRAYVDDLLTARGDVLPADRVQAARARSGEALDAPRVAAQIRAFFLAARDAPERCGDAAADPA